MASLISRIVDGPEEERSRPPMDRATQFRLLMSYLPDWIITIVLLALVAYFTNHSGFKREFSLTDTSIQHTFAVKERISFGLCIGLAAGVPVLLIVLIGFGWRRSFWDVHNGILSLLLSVALATAITDLVKVTVGRPRPDLIDRCQPALGSTNGIPYGLVTVKICTSTDQGLLNDGFKSFFSGHTSFAFAGLGILSLYLAGKMHLFDRRGHAIKAWLALIPLMGAALIAISRTMDYRHHPTDVLIGGIVGMTIAIFSYHLYYPSLFHPSCHLPYSPRTSPTSSNHQQPSSGSGSSQPLDPDGHYVTPDVPMDDEVPRGTMGRPLGGKGVGPIGTGVGTTRGSYDRSEGSV